MTMVSFAVRDDRIREDLNKLNILGMVNRGVNRLAYTEAETDSHAYIRREMEVIGMKTRVDGAGNLYGILNPGGIDRRKIVIGSHLDSVTEGGNYDGALGVVIGMELARILSSNGADISLEVVAFRAEEPARFGVGCLGSKLATGYLTAHEAIAIKDRKGTTLYDAIKHSGFNPDEIEIWEKNSIVLYIEPHIEQGSVLETEGMPIGVVTGIAAPIRYSVKLLGREDHSGATPMNMRNDALTAFSEMNLKLEQLAAGAEKQGLPIRATVGYVTVDAGTVNKVPGIVTFPVEIRAPDIGMRDRFENAVLESFSEIAERRGVILALEEMDRGVPVMLKKDDYAVIGQAAEKLSVPHIYLPSGAGHDAQYVALSGVPAAMLFIRNSGGSHNPKEDVKIEDAVTATKVLVVAIEDEWSRAR